MDHLKDILAQLSQPAFIVKDGIIIDGNQAALQRQIQLHTDVSDLICIGNDEYKMYTQGKLCLTLNIENVLCNATVTTLQDYHLFCLVSGYESPELRVLALAAQQLREPLSKAMISTDLLLPNTAVREDREATKYLAQVNHSLHQLLRAVSNMSDAAHYAEPDKYNMQTIDATAVIKEIMDTAMNLAASMKRVIVFSIPMEGQAIYCTADQDKLERAILNLLSNAMKFTPIDSVIGVEFRKIGNRLFFTIENKNTDVGPHMQSNMFNRYLREPGIEDGRNGIGLGMSIVHSVAAAHGGTVLIERSQDSKMRITMTISLNQPIAPVLRSLIKLPIDYTGGYDRYLLELSDVLPDQFFSSENM